MNVGDVISNLFNQTFFPGMQPNGAFYDGMGPVVSDGAFCESFHAYSNAYWHSDNRQELEKGDKIVLPAAALEQLSRMHIEFPIMFEISNADPLLDFSRKSHCSVLEFTAEPGKVYLPMWMIQNLGLSPDGHSLVQLRNKRLPKGEFVKFRAHETEFAMISNPRAVLEFTLRTYSCLTENDTIIVIFADKQYHLDVTEVRPRSTDPAAVSIIETDIRVDFEEPRDYKEWEQKQREETDRKTAQTKRMAEDEESAWVNDPSKVLESAKRSYFQTIEARGAHGNKLKQRDRAVSSNVGGPPPAMRASSHPVSAPLRGEALGAKVTRRHSYTSMVAQNSIRKEEEVVGNMRYIYEVDGAGNRKVVRRLPVRKGFGSDSTGRALKG